MLFQRYTDGEGGVVVSNSPHCYRTIVPNGALSPEAMDNFVGFSYNKLNYFNRILTDLAA